MIQAKSSVVYLYMVGVTGIYRVEFDQIAVGSPMLLHIFRPWYYLSRSHTNFPLKLNISVQNTRGMFFILHDNWHACQVK